MATSADPMSAIWSLLGSSPIAMILFFLLRGEQAERRAAVSKMLEIVEADVANKSALTDRLKGQDDALGKLLDKVGELQAKLAASQGRPTP